jgi:hypothetical protein
MDAARGAQPQYRAQHQASRELAPLGSAISPCSSRASRRTGPRSQLLERRAPFWRGSAPRPEGKRTVDALTEPQQIALGALREVFGANWRKVVSDITAAGSDPALSRHRECLQALPSIIQRHQERLCSNWPPSRQELEAFERLLDGVRLAYTCEVIAPNKMPRPKGERASALG